jgi:hypothetical protein
VAYVIASQVTCVGGGSTRTVGNDEAFDGAGLDVFLVQAWQGGAAVPVQEFGPEELHQQEVFVIVEDRAIPVTGLPFDSVGAIQVPGEVSFALDFREVNVLEDGEDVEGPGITKGLLEAHDGSGGAELSVGPGRTTEGGDGTMHDTSVFAQNRRRHGVKLLYKGKNWSNENIEDQDFPLNIPLAHDRGEATGSFNRLGSGESKDIFDLYVPSEEDPEVLVRVDELDERPLRIANGLEDGGELALEVVFGTQDDSLVTVDAEAGGDRVTVDDREGEFDVVDRRSRDGKVIGSGFNRGIFYHG